MKSHLSTSIVSLMLGLALTLPALAQAPVSDVSTSQRRVPVSGGVAVDDGYDSARTYGTRDEDSSTAVEDLPRQSRSPANDSAGTEGTALYRQFQQLQEEVASLRGQVEEQSYEIQKLKQQHQEDLAALDQRLAGASAAPASSSTASNAGASKPATAAGNSEGKEEYEAAYAKLKAKDYAGATSAFKTFVSQHPTSDYAGNSWFWLGFVYQTQGDLANATQSFESLLERFPGHSKADDGKYNLGKLYHQQGKSEQARALLKEVAAGSSKSAPLAKSYLESM